MGWSDWEEFRRLTPMIKQTYKSKNRIKTTEKQTSHSVKPQPKKGVKPPRRAFPLIFQGCAGLGQQTLSDSWP